MQITEVDAKVFGIPGWEGKMLPGLVTNGDHPFLPVMKPNYQFNVRSTRLLSFVWGRELSRPDYDDRLGLLAMGPKGSGKSTLFEQFFARLGVPVVSDTGYKNMTLYDLIGSKGLVNGNTVWEDGKIVAAMRY